MATTPPAAAPFPVPYVPMSLARVVPIDPDQPVILTAVRCATCRDGVQPSRDGRETRCVTCDGAGWLPACPHCHGDDEVEVWNDAAGDHETVPCRCVAAAVEPVALAAD